MPIYEFYCKKCDKGHESLNKVGDFQSNCPFCGAEATKLMSAPNINMGPVPIGGEYDANLGTFVRSNNHRKDLMREQGVSEWGASPKPDGEAWV